MIISCGVLFCQITAVPVCIFLTFSAWLFSSLPSARPLVAAALLLPCRRCRCCCHDVDVRYTGEQFPQLPMVPYVKTKHAVELRCCCCLRLL
ncbi:unnamed protein product [Citrullus colocynthis]|uniref:Secreted protein n=1 Tax=Citrullus colocynthis TaxID=252529 RepID=A0ABP0XW82_9ROSI